jgi:hypothetical protein
MRDSDFYAQIEHIELAWGERSIFVPIFYYDNMTFSAMFSAPYDALLKLMPSSRMFPLRIMPGQGGLGLSAMEFRDSDIGPYNEFAVSIPFTMDKPSPSLTGVLRKAPPEPWVYIHRLPVTTQIALDAGVEFANYPKFLAEIEFEEAGDWITCNLAEEGRHILTFSVRKPELEDVGRSRSHYFTVREGRLLRSEGVSSRCQAGASKDVSSVRLELGDHPMAQELAEIGMGRLLSYQYTPQYQSILTPVLESFAA